MPSIKYAKPPIIEALCEFTFVMPDPAKANFITLPGLLQMKLGEAYTGTPKEQRVQQVLSKPNSPAPDLVIQDQLFRVQLPNKDNTRLVAIGTNTLSVNILAPYDSWERDFQPRVEQALKAYLAVAQPKSVSRIGIRYINKLTVEGQAIAENYFRIAEPHQDNKMGQLENFMKRLEYKTEAGITTILTLAKLAPEAPSTSTFLLDIDVVAADLEISDEKAVLQVVKELHNREGETFENLITDAARRLFNV